MTSALSPPFSSPPNPPNASQAMRNHGPTTSIPSASRLPRKASSQSVKAATVGARRGSQIARPLHSSSSSSSLSASLYDRPALRPTHSVSEPSIAASLVLLPSPPEEHVTALHDFASTNATCLSFRAGQLIKVFNRDRSGWWDGELDGKRGWFPSNYVDQASLPPDAGHRRRSDADDSPDRDAGAEESTPTRPTSPGELRRMRSAPRILSSPTISSPTSRRSRGESLASTSSLPYTATPTSSHRGSLPRFSGPSTIMDPILHALALLQNAVRANRVAHFQPSTACVISSVRCVLSATDCLTRESSVLKTHVVLAKQRKQILSELSRLVTQARKASAPTTDEGARQKEMKVMLQMADRVLSNVNRFLEVAVECGVELPNRRSVVYDDESADDGGYGNDDDDDDDDGLREAQDKTPTPDSPVASASFSRSSSIQSIARGAKSMSDLRRGHRRGADDPSSAGSGQLSPVPSGGRSGHSSSKLGHDVLAEGWQLGGPLLPSLSSAGSRLFGFVSGSGSSSDSLPDEPLTPAGPGTKTAAEVVKGIAVTHDQLLSIIAAFIGHLHTHNRSSHASSYAHLIDMTRATVDKVRDLLVIVEAVGNHPTLQASRAKEIAVLSSTRESLYVATTAMVTAARVVTSTPAATSAGEDEEKSRLLSAATAVLRAGGECLGAVKLCIDRRDVDPSIEIALVDPSRDSDASRESVHQPAIADADEEEEEVEEKEDDDLGEGQHLAAEGPRARRGKHTLSFLGRKATSLSCLKERYEVDGYSNQFDDIEEDKESSGEGEIAPRPTGKDEEEDQTARVVDQSPSSTSTVSTRRGLKGPTPLQQSLLTNRGRSSSLSMAFRSAGEAEGANVMVRRPLASMEEESSTDSLASSEDMSRIASSQTFGSVASSDDHTELSSAHSSVELKSKHLPLQSSADVLVPQTAPLNGGFPQDPTTWLTHNNPRIHRGQPLPLPTSRTETLRKEAGGVSRPRSTSNPVSNMVSMMAMERSLPPTPTKSASPGASKDDLLQLADHAASDVCFNSEGQVTGATLAVLVERMTPHDTTIDATFFNTFFLTFRLFTTPRDLLDALIARFDLQPEAGRPLSPDELQVWQDAKLTPIRLRIFNFLKTWLESHWQPSTDVVVLEPLAAFCREHVMSALPRAGQRLIDLAQKRLISSQQQGAKAPRLLQRAMSAERLKSGVPVGADNPQPLYPTSAAALGRAGPLPPTPAISKSLLSSLRSLPHTSINILDFDPLELARQLTIMESKLYCAIQPWELVGQEFSKKAGVSTSVNVKGMSSLTTYITGWVSECILNESDAKKRTGLIKFFIKLGDRCMALNNFNTLTAIKCALTSSTIARLKKTWDGLPAKYRGMMDAQHSAIELTRNYASYRARLRSILPPALPFVGLFLTDITFCHEGNADFRPSPLNPEKKLLNFDKYQKIARIVGDLQKFQVPYNLLEVPEIQLYLRQSLDAVQHNGDSVGDLYRRSLLLEPRQPSGTAQGTSHIPTRSETKMGSLWKI